MSKIICNYNLTEARWSFEREDTHDYYTLEICFRFTDGTPIVNFSNLTFGYTLSENDQVLYSDNYPRSGQSYESSDQLNLETVTVSVIPGKTYSLFVYGEERGIKTESNYTIDTNIPPQPYPSWSWSGTGWVPPIPYPPITEGNIYYWNESTRSWDIGVELVDTSGYDVE